MNRDIVPVDLVEIRACVDATTDGPWDDVRIGRAGDGDGASHEEQLCNGSGVGVVIMTHDGSEEAVANTVFIASSRTYVPAMVAELDAWRDAFRAFAAATYERAGEPYDRMAALLPESRLNDARERFEKSLRHDAPVAKPTDDEVTEWGRKFEASAVRMSDVTRASRSPAASDEETKTRPMTEPKFADLELIRVRASAATLGPLRPGSEQTWHVFAPYADALEGPNGERVLFRMNQNFEHKADALFFAHARTDVPVLVDEVETWRKLGVELLDATTALDSEKFNSLIGRCEQCACM